MPATSRLSTMEQSLDPAPPYIEVPDNTSSISQAPTLPRHGYPIMHYPELRRGKPVARDDHVYMLESWRRESLVNDFFRAVHEGDHAHITAIVHQGLVSPSVLNDRGRSALHIAVQDKNADTVRCLVELGADLNPFATAGAYPYPERTPLMMAAENGSLVIVKILFEAGADDALVAPDGQIALRLAVKNGHREVVRCLPARRRGGWRRWKKQHSESLKGIGNALENIFDLCKAVFFHIPAFFLWYVPKKLVFKPLGKGIKYAVENRRLFAGWCKRQVVKLPRRAGRLVKGVAKLVAKTPKAIALLVKWLWRVLKAAPEKIMEAARILGRGLGKVVKALGSALGAIVRGFFSVLHTMISLMVEFFGRITLKDVWNGFCSLIRAVFIGLPTAVWSGVRALGRAAFMALVYLVGGFGIVTWFFVERGWWIISFGPRQIIYMIRDIAKSVAKGFQEVMVLINPKYGV